MELLKFVILLHALGLAEAFQNNSDYDALDLKANDTDATNQTEYHISSFRLSKKCSGTLEVLSQNGTWVPAVLTSGSSEEVSNTICENLNCGKLFQSQNKSSNHMLCMIDCISEDWDIVKCTEAWYQHCTHKTELICGHQALRLAGGTDHCAGRVEVWEDGEWGTVCDDGWDLQNGNVVCAQLGCGYAVEVIGQNTTFSQFGMGEGPVLLDDVECSGTERNLWECPSLKLSGDCGHKEDVGVVCSEHRAVRLSGGLDRCSGKVEIHRNGSWGTVCDNGWYMQEAGMVCSMLDCGSPVEFSFNFFTHNNAAMWYYHCEKKARTLWDCREYLNYQNLCVGLKAAGLICNESLGLPNNTADTTLGPLTTVPGPLHMDDDKPIDFLFISLLGNCILSFFIFMAVMIIAVLFRKWKKKKVMPVQQNLQGSAERQDNDYRDDVDLIKVTMNNAENNVGPTFQAQSNNGNPSFDSDYEDYDFSAEPASAMSTFQNSLRNRTEDRSPMLNCVPLFSVVEEGPQVPTIIHSKAIEDTSSTSSEESHFNNIPANFNPGPPARYPSDSSSTSSGECYMNTGDINEQLQPTETSSQWQQPPAQAPAFLQQPVTYNPVYNGYSTPTSFQGMEDQDEFDSSSTSSGECYENMPEENEQAGLLQNHEPGESSSEDDYDDIANYK
ncbi:T-cell differentiation antigen CD6 isoform X2 [Amia ocellicauda]|uniref:T-cell differentiation antigen CD6 isoform X2 n=1 Tax=Amia ocellicauda TaxID=2972642 RepID=UPI003463AF0A